MQVSHSTQCRAVDGQIDRYPVHFHPRDRPYTRRRDVTRISARERWCCPNEGCGRQYKRTSTIGIGRHKKLCHNRPTVTGRSIFHYDLCENTFRGSALKPIAATVLLQRIKTHRSILTVEVIEYIRKFMEIVYRNSSRVKKYNQTFSVAKGDRPVLIFRTWVYQH